MSERPAPCVQFGLAPIGLSRPVAASYVGLGTTLFDRLVADGRMPRPRRINGRLIWVRTELEKALEALPYDGVADGDRPTPSFRSRPTAQEALRQKLKALKAMSAEKAEQRRAEKTRRREAIKAGVEMPDVFTPSTLAEFWGCSDQHVRNLIRKGALVSFSLGGKLVRIRADEVRAYEARQLAEGSRR